MIGYELTRARLQHVANKLTLLERCRQLQHALLREAAQVRALDVAQALLDGLRARNPLTRYELRAHWSRPVEWPGPSEYRPTRPGWLSQQYQPRPFNVDFLRPGDQIGWFDLSRNRVDTKVIYLTLAADGRLWYRVDVPLPAEEEEALDLLLRRKRIEDYFPRRTVDELERLALGG